MAADKDLKNQPAAACKILGLRYALIFRVNVVVVLALQEQFVLGFFLSQSAKDFLQLHVIGCGGHRRTEFRGG